MYNAIQDILNRPIRNSHGKQQQQITGFAIVRIPYFLEPNYDMNKSYIETNRDRLIQKWGGIQNWNRQKQRHQLKERGLEVGISHFNLDRLASNTMRSHILIQYISRTHGLYVSEYIYDVLNQYHFVNGHALNDVDALCSTVSNALQTLYEQQPTCFYSYDLDHHHEQQTSSPLEFSDQQIYNVLCNDDQNLQDTIEQTVNAVYEMGINGIPTFIINGTHVLNGAIHSNEIIHVLDTIVTEQHEKDKEENNDDKVVGTPSILTTNLLQIPPSILQFGSYIRDTKRKQTPTIPTQKSTSPL